MQTIEKPIIRQYENKGVIKHLRWWIAGLLFFATVINYLNRQTLSVLAPILRDELNFTSTDYSHMVFAFLIAYMIMQSGFGRIMDWIGTRLGMSLSIIVWSLASIAHMAAGSVLGFGICRFLLGVGEAGNWPGSVKAISEWFPVKERALAIGIFNSGSCIGAIIAPPLVVWLAVTWNWRLAFAVIGLLGFVWLVFWLMLYRLPHLHPRISESEFAYIKNNSNSSSSDTLVSKKSWMKLLSDKNVLSLLFARMMCDPVWWFYVFWLPDYFKHERNFDLTMIGLFVWIPFLAADIGNFAGGGASSYLVKIGLEPVRARKIVMFVSACLMLAGIPAVLGRNAYVALTFISIATFAYSSWGTNILTLPTDIFENRTIASVTGLSGTGGGIGGMAFTLITGIVVDHFSYTPIFIAAGIMPLIAACFIVFGIERNRVSAE